MKPSATIIPVQVQPEYCINDTAGKVLMPVNLKATLKTYPVQITFKPIQKVCNWDPHWQAAADSAKYRDATAATSDESSPPDKSTPNGTSVISLLITACRIKKGTA